MLRSRIIPCLLIKDKGLTKTVKFTSGKYVGDPLNAVKIFNEKSVDELMVLDIDATSCGRDPDYDLIEKLANECRMPLCYGGGIKTVAQAKKIISLGVEKVAISSGLLSDFDLINELAEVIGRQSIVAVLDVKKRVFGGYDIYTINGGKKFKLGLLEVLSILEEAGIGELVINSIDRDGTCEGYDMNLIDKVRSKISCPLTVLGGAGSQEDILELVKKYRIIGAAAGSIFVFKGVYKAVLINYLDSRIRHKIFQIATT